ncbi:ATP-binding protein [Streptomyces sp. NPDC058657]|uniref:ATP-binding protein n=1 Tax=unclassified Streptomyces TaxID=2593676 RepID=UPI003665C945
MALLSAVKARSGLSFRALERRARDRGDHLPVSTLAAALNRGSLPGEPLVSALIRACGGDEEAVTEWARVRGELAGGGGTRATERPLDPAADGPGPGGREHRPGQAGTGERPLVPSLLPPDQPFFVGRRDALEEGRALLGRQERGPQTLLVTGPAGIGKTAFAIRVGHLLVTRFPDGRLYADLQGYGGEPADPFTVLGAFLRALGIQGGAVPADPTGRVHLYRTLLAQQRVLVLLDNAADATQVRDLLPSGEHCAAVATSRTTLAGLSGARLPLSVLDASAGLALLREMIGAARATEEAEAARSIVEACHGLPLAVWVAGARLAARPHWPLGKVALALADELRKLDELAVGHIAVRASLELTYRGMAPAGRHALRMAALLPRPDFAGWSLAALLGTSVARAEALLDDLTEVHLVEARPVAPTGLRYRLHDLVGLFGRERAEREDGKEVRARARDRLLGASLHLADRAADTLSVDFQRFSQRDLAVWTPTAADTDQLLADPLAWFDEERQFLIRVADQALDHAQVAPAAGLATALTTLFQVRSHFDDWERLQSRALEAALHSGDRHSAATLHRCLGELTTILDRYPEAVAHFEQALLLSEGQDPSYRAGATAGLAYVHRLLGQYATAVAHFTSAVDLARAAHNVNCLVYATNGIGVIDLEQGRVEAAVARFTECLRLSQEAGYGPGEAQALRCLGQSHRKRGDLSAAADCYRQAAGISTALGDRLTATHANCWLGDVLVRSGEHREGFQLLHQSLATYREFGNLWGEAATLLALAEAGTATGDAVSAVRQAGAAVGLWRRIGSRTWLATGLEALADACTRAGDHRAAQKARAEAAELSGTTP